MEKQNRGNYPKVRIRNTKSPLNERVIRKIEKKLAKERALAVWGMPIFPEVEND
ncbi:hypothetical protein M0R19_01995 [Candidatus Pacearchaeota archaeon]|nr:hypothetical protein [Candidatus Pacearchaeota archaeon]